jgi:catechol 2,3-dioxygenase-like lactoylglutathione lyase family enzyme
MKNLFERIDSTFILVTDMERSLEWYTTQLGLELLHNGGSVVDFKVGQGDTMLTLVESRNFTPGEFIDVLTTTPRFNFKTSDIDSAHKLLAGQGIDVSEIVSGGVIKTFHFRDPDGNLLNVCYETEASQYYINS